MNSSDYACCCLRYKTILGPKLTQALIVGDTTSESQVCSEIDPRYSLSPAIAEPEVTMSSTPTPCTPKPSSLTQYCLRLLLELFVTKKVRLPARRSAFTVSTVGSGHDHIMTTAGITGHESEESERNG